MQGQDTLVEFCDLMKKHRPGQSTDTINKLLALVVKEISPDQIIPFMIGGETLLHMVAPYSDIDCVVLFDSNKLPALDIKDYNCQTPLQIACYHGNENMVRLLLENGALVNSGSIPTLVYLCCKITQDKHLSILKLLIRHGADANAVFPDCDREIDLNCAQCGLEDFYRNKVGPSRIIEFLGELIKAGTNINYIDTWGRNLLHLVCSHDDTEVANFLILNGCDYELRDEDGNLPIDYMISSIREQLVQIINLKNCR